METLYAEQEAIEDGNYLSDYRDSVLYSFLDDSEQYLPLHDGKMSGSRPSDTSVRNVPLEFKTEYSVSEFLRIELEELSCINQISSSYRREATPPSQFPTNKRKTESVRLNSSSTTPNADNLFKKPMIAKINECQLCEKTFSSAYSLKRHTKSHTGEKPHKCLHCGKKFVQKEELKHHLVGHRAEKPHECPHCDKKFSQKGHLNRHLFTHTPDKPYRCFQCGRTFIQKSELKNHMTTHAEGKKHKCSVCYKMFSLEKTLKRHMESNCMGQPHECPYCGEKYNRKDSMRNHMLTHTTENNPTINVEFNS